MTITSPHYARHYPENVLVQIETEFFTFEYLNGDICLSENKLKWYRRFLNKAYEVSTWSKDQSTQVGAVAYNMQAMSKLPIGEGYNGFPRKVNDNIQARHERPLKYMYCEHAERNLIYNNARKGIAMENATLFVSHFPCHDCARGVIQSGIIEVVFDKSSITAESIKDAFVARWGESFMHACIMMNEADIKIIGVSK